MCATCTTASEFSRRGCSGSCVSRQTIEIGARRGKRLYNLRHRIEIITIVAMSVTAAQAFANRSPCSA